MIQMNWFKPISCNTSAFFMCPNQPCLSIENVVENIKEHIIPFMCRDTKRIYSSIASYTVTNILPSPLNEAIHLHSKSDSDSRPEGADVCWRLLRAFRLAGRPCFRLGACGFSLLATLNIRRLLLRTISPIKALILFPHSGASNWGYSIWIYSI